MTAAPIGRYETVLRIDARPDIRATKHIMLFPDANVNMQIEKIAKNRVFFGFSAKKPHFRRSAAKLSRVSSVILTDPLARTPNKKEEHP